jgi:hypothetical protein
MNVRVPGGVELLVSRGADAHARGKKGETAIASAAEQGDVEAVTVLLARGVNVNVPDYRGYTPLMLAAHHDRASTAAVRLLLAHGADPAATGEGETAASLALKRGDTELSRLLSDVEQNQAPRGSQPGSSATTAVSHRALRSAASKALELLERTSPTFLQKGGCNSCHNQMLPAAAQAFARSRGIPTGETIAQVPDAVSEQTAERYLESSVGGGAGVTALGFDLFGRALAGQAADARLLSEIHFIKSMQMPDGHWRGGHDRRPPLLFDDFTPTAFMIFALDHFGPQPEAVDTTARVARARAWLTATRAERTQERAFRLLGLAWSKAARAIIDSAIGDLRALQAPDGGWPQLSTLPTDGYATGLALYALSVGGVPAADPAYRAGLEYLLSTQASDGTWHVKTRALGFQPYFESGYPYGPDQWISAAGTAYATMAIAAAVEGPLGTTAARADR